MTSVLGQQDRRVKPVILSGGSGNRLWPLSRSSRPKQLLELTGSRTMLQATIDRVADPVRFADPVLVAGETHLKTIRAQLADTHAGAGDLILEPAGRNTAPAIALAAFCTEPDDLLLVMPSDHLIRDTAAFLSAIDAARPIAENGWLVTFGIQPTRAETGYGYIKRGQPLVGTASRVERFVEKPDASRAAMFVTNGDYHWNAGIFLFRAGSYIDALATHAPCVFSNCRRAVAEGTREQRCLRPLPEAFAACPSISVDHAVMEHSDRIAVVPLSAGWSDIGSWESLHEVSNKDEQANSCVGEAVLASASGCLIHSQGPLIVAVGVQDMAIIAMDDVVLVVPRGNSEAVREAVDILRSRGDHRL